MSLEKLTCCLAHPMTALRSLKNKVNEVITAHNDLVDKVENLPTGEGGETTATAGVCLVKFTAKANDGYTEYTSPTKDKLYSEIDATYKNGGLLCGRATIESPLDTATNELLLNATTDFGDGNLVYVFTPVDPTFTYAFIVMPDDSVEILVS